MISRAGGSKRHGSGEVGTEVSGLDYPEHAEAALLLATLVPLPKEDGDDDLGEDEGGVPGGEWRKEWTCSETRARLMMVWYHPRMARRQVSGFPVRFFVPDSTIYGSPNLAMDISSCDGSDDPEKRAVTGTNGHVPRAQRMNTLPGSVFQCKAALNKATRCWEADDRGKATFMRKYDYRRHLKTRHLGEEPAEEKKKAQS
jgi:hypothetical protein